VQRCQCSAVSGQNDIIGCSEVERKSGIH
jgi:hypothetical protein